LGRDSIRAFLFSVSRFASVNQSTTKGRSES
jgi:hypothetical protein